MTDRRAVLRTLQKQRQHALSVASDEYSRSLASTEDNTASLLTMRKFDPADFNDEQTYDSNPYERNRTDALKLILYDLNSAIAPREIRLLAIRSAMEEFDHDEEMLHDEELELRADQILLQKLCYAMSIDPSDEEVGYICAALEMVYRAGKGRLAQSFHEICDAVLPMFVEMIKRPPFVEAAEAVEEEKEVFEEQVVEEEDEETLDTFRGIEPVDDYDPYAEVNVVEDDDSSAESVTIPAGTGEYFDHLKGMGSKVEEEKEPLPVSEPLQLEAPPLKPEEQQMEPFDPTGGAGRNQQDKHMYTPEQLYAMAEEIAKMKEKQVMVREPELKQPEQQQQNQIVPAPQMVPVEPVPNQMVPVQPAITNQMVPFAAVGPYTGGPPLALPPSQQSVSMNQMVPMGPALPPPQPGAVPMQGPPPPMPQGQLVLQPLQLPNNSTVPAPTPTDNEEDPIRLRGGGDNASEYSEDVSLDASGVDSRVDIDPYLDESVYTQDSEDVRRLGERIRSASQDGLDDVDEEYEDENPFVAMNQRIREAREGLNQSTYTADQSAYTTDSRGLNQSAYTADSYALNQSEYEDDGHGLDQSTFSTDNRTLNQSTYSADSRAFNQSAFTTDSSARAFNQSAFTTDSSARDFNQSAFTTDSRSFNQSTFTADQSEYDEDGNFRGDYSAYMENEARGVPNLSVVQEDDEHVLNQSEFDEDGNVNALNHQSEYDEDGNALNHPSEYDEDGNFAGHPSEHMDKEAYGAGDEGFGDEHVAYQTEHFDGPEVPNVETVVDQDGNALNQSAYDENGNFAVDESPYMKEYTNNEQQYEQPWGGQEFQGEEDPFGGGEYYPDDASNPFSRLDESKRSEVTGEGMQNRMQDPISEEQEIHIDFGQTAKLDDADLPAHFEGSDIPTHIGDGSISASVKSSVTEFTVEPGSKKKLDQSGTEYNPFGGQGNEFHVVEEDPNEDYDHFEQEADGPFDQRHQGFQNNVGGTAPINNYGQDVNNANVYGEATRGIPPHTEGYANDEYVRSGQTVNSHWSDGSVSQGGYGAPQRGFREPQDAPQGGFHTNQGGFDYNQEGYDATQGGFDASQGGYQYDSQGGYDASQGGYQDDLQGGFDASQGGYQDDLQGGYDASQGGYDSQGGFDASQGGYNSQGGYDASQGGHDSQGDYDAPQEGYGAPQGDYNAFSVPTFNPEDENMLHGGSVEQEEQKYDEYNNQQNYDQDDIFEFREPQMAKPTALSNLASGPVGEALVCPLAQRKVLKILRYFSRVLSAMEQLAQQPGLVDALLYQMTRYPHSEDDEDEIAARVDAIACVVNLACAEENKIMLVYHPGLLDAVINIANHDPVEEAREHATIVMMNLAYAEENKIHMVNQDNLLDTLVFLLSDVSPFTRRYASAALFTLACTYANTAVMARHCDGGILEALRKVLLNDPVDEARVNAAEALFNMARNNSDDTVENMGNHPKLLASLAHSVLTDYSPDVRAYAARALEWLSSDIHYPMACHQRLLQALTTASQWTKTTCIAEALKMQASLPENRRSMVEHPGLLDALAQLSLLDGINDDEVKTCAMTAMERLSKEPSTRHLMARSEGVMTALTRATFGDNYDDDEEETPQVLLMKTALKNLAEHL